MADAVSDCVLVIFAKAPVLGTVKTRLSPELSPQQAVNIHRVLVEHCIEMASKVAGVDVELWVSAPDPWWLQLQRRFALTIHQQQGCDLGERMDYALTDVLSRATRAIWIGSDCPYIDGRYIKSAQQALLHAEVVLGPAEDGGYVLVGLSVPRPVIFSGIDWGSADVLEQTRSKLQQHGARWLELECLSDIDRPEDLRRLLIARPELSQRFLYEG